MGSCSGVRKMNLYNIFKKLDIKFEEIEHEPVFTIEQAQAIKNRIKGTGCKNLFLTDKRGKYILAILEENKKANIKQIEKLVNTSHLSFAKTTELQSVLQLEKGSVTPLGILNDIDNKVVLVIDTDLKDKILLFHPNTNTKTISITYDNLIKFIEFRNHNYMFIS